MNEEKLSKEAMEISLKILALEYENQQLKDNWNKLKEWLTDYLKETPDIGYSMIVAKMEELEKESDVK